jgi:arylsulfatase A-like enzyme
LNVVVLVVDSLRYDHLGCNGNDRVRTPMLDAFAAGATLFEQSIVGSFATVPVRHDLFRGRWGDPFQAWAPLPHDVATLPGYLRERGYVAMLIHDTPHLINFGCGFDRPFHGWDMVRGNEVDRWRTDRIARADYPCDPAKLRSRDRFAAQTIRNGLRRQREEDYCSPRLFSTAMRWLEENRDHERFFLWIDCFDPHEPWDPPRHYVDLYDPGYEGEEVTFPLYGRCDFLSPAELRHVRALYAAEVTMVDRWIGRFLEKLADVGRERDTLVVIASDHGFLFGEHGLIGKGDFYRDVARQVLMVRHPEGRGAGRRTSTLVQPVDLFPSVVELVGLAPPSGLDGRSWAAALDGPVPGREVAFSGGTRSLEVTDGALTHVQAFDGRWCLLDHPRPSLRELYDLASDPAQAENVAAANPEVVARLHSALVEHYRAHGASDATIRLLEEGIEAGSPTAPPGDTHAWVRDALGPAQFLPAEID